MPLAAEDAAGRRQGASYAGHPRRSTDWCTATEGKGEWAASTTTPAQMHAEASNRTSKPTALGTSAGCCSVHRQRAPLCQRTGRRRGPRQWGNAATAEGRIGRRGTTAAAEQSAELLQRASMQQQHRDVTCTYTCTCVCNDALLARNTSAHAQELHQ